MSVRGLALPQPVTDRVKEVWEHRVWGPTVKLVLAVAGVWFASSILLNASIQGVLAGAALGTLFGLLAVGIILIYRTNRIINFAAAALGAAPGVLAAMLLVQNRAPWIVAFPIAVFGGALMGGLIDVVVIRRFATAPRLILTVVTIGVSQGLAFLSLYVPIWLGSEGEIISYVPTPFKAIRINVGTNVFSGDYPFSFGIAVLAVIGLAAFLRYTRIGIALRASAENADRASLLGIPVKRVETVAWVIGGGLAGLTIFLRTALVGVPSDGSLGPKVLLFALTAAVIARMESIPTAFVAGMGIGALAQASVGYAGKDSLASAIMLVIILGALLIQRGRMSRAYDTGTSTWQTVKEFRPIPLELRGLTEVFWARIGMGVLAIGALIAAPFLLPESRLGFLQLVVIEAIIVVSLVVLTGWAGQISLGQYAFVGVGAAVGGKLAAEAGQDFFVTLAAGVLAGAVVAVLIGIPALRIPGLYLAVATLAFAAAMQFYFLDRSYLIGQLFAPDRDVRIEIPVLWERITLTSELGTPGKGYYFLCLGLLGLVLLGARAYRNNRSGRVLIGIRENSRAASSYAVNPSRTKLAAFAISGGIAALGGVLLAYQNGAVDAATYGITPSILVFVIAVIGGLTSLTGAVVATVVIKGISFFGNDILANLDLIVTSVGLVLVLMTLPGGFAEVIFGVRDKFLRWIAARRDILVPSLVADRRADTEAQEGIVTRAEKAQEEREAELVGTGSEDGD